MQVRFTARGDFRPLQTSLRNLGVSMNQSVQGFGHSVRTNVSTPMDDMMKKMQRGRLTFRDLGTVMRDQTRFLQHHNQAMAQSGEVVARASGRMSVMRDNTRNLDASMVTLGQRLTLVNTAMHAVSRNTIAMGKNMQWAGRQVMVGITIPLALLARTALQVGEEYDRNMTRIIKVNNDASMAAAQSEEMFNLVSDSLRRQTSAIVDLGAELGFLADQSTEMVAQFSQMGFAGADLDELSEAAMRLSRVSGTDLQTSIELTRITAQAFGVELQDLTETFARLNLVENNTALALKDMAISLPVVAGVANTMGMEIETVAGLLAMMKENGISAKEGATALRTGLIQIVQEATDPAIEAFEKINLDLIEMKENMQVEGEGDVMHFFVELGEHLQHIAQSGEGSQAMLNDFTGAIGKLTGTRQAARFLTFLSEIPDMFEEGSVAQRSFIGATTEAEEALRIYEFEQRQVQESAAGMAETLRAQLNVEMQRVGESMLDAANAVRRIGVEILRWFNQLDETVRRNILIAAAAAASLGVITMTMGILVNAIGQLGVAFTMLFRRTDYLAKQEEALRQAVSGASTQIDRSAVSMGAAARSADATTASLHRMAEGYLRAGQAASGMVTAQTTSATGSAVADAAESGVFVGTPGGRERRDEGRQERRGVRARSAAVGAGIANIGRAALDNMKKFVAKMKAASGFSAKLGVSFKAVGKVIGMIKASMAGILGVLAAITALPILANPGAALSGFRDALEGPFNNLRSALESIMTTVRRLTETFREMGEDGSGIAKVSEFLGRIGGIIVGVIVDALAIVLNIFNGIANAAEFLFRMMEGVLSLLTGDWENAINAFQEGLRALGRAVVDLVVAPILDAFGGIVRTVENLIPGISNHFSDTMNEFSDELRNAEILQSNITEEVMKQRQEARELRGLYEDHEEALEESEEIKQRLLEAEIDINDFTKQDILDNENLTDELKAQLLARIRRKQIDSELQSLQQQEARTVQRLNKVQEGDIHERRHLEERLNEIKQSEVELLEESVNAIENYNQELRDRREEEELYNSLVGKTLDNKEALKARQEEINEKLREAERRASQWVSALQSASRNVMSNIVRAVEDALEAQIRAEEEAIDRREEMRMRANQEEIDRINDNADAELQRIEEQERREEEANRRREQFFQEERRRINLLRGMQEDQAMLDISIARGDIAEAARIRIGMQARSEEFIIESYERQQEAFQDARQEEIKTEREKIKEIRDEQIQALEDAQDLIEKQFEIERDAARDAAEERRRSVRQYLDDWGNVIPATESEFRAHMAALERSMNGFGISMREISKKYTRESGDNIRNGFQTAVDAAADSVAESEKWRAAGESVAESFTEGLREELKDIERQIEGDIAEANIGRTSDGVRGIQYRDPRVNPDHPNAFHSGGRVTGPSSPGLKPDETPAVLQKGEYVIQRSAVRQVGEDYLNLINNGMRFHDGGPVRASGVNLTDSGALGPAAGSMIGKFANSMLERFTYSGSGGEDITGKMTGKEFGRSVGRAIGEAAMMFMPGAIGDAAGWRGDSGTGWPPRQWGVLSANTRAAKQYWRGLSDFPGGIGTGVHRGVAASDHSWGKALDFMVAPLGNMPTDSQRRLGWQVAGWHVNNPDVFGTKYVIWDKMINSGDARGWRPYTRYGTNPGPTLGHYDHVHVSYLHEGGLVPSMRTGGKIKLDNTIANLHRGERVLTEPSTRALETAIQEFAASGGGRNSYNLEFNIDGGSIDEAELAKKVVFEIDRMERTKGRKRVVRT